MFVGWFGLNKGVCLKKSVLLLALFSVVTVCSAGHTFFEAWPSNYEGDGTYELLPGQGVETDSGYSFRWSGAYTEPELVPEERTAIFESSTPAEKKLKPLT